MITQFWTAVSTKKDPQPTVREEVAITVAALKKLKSAGINNIPAELFQASGKSMIDDLTKICDKIWKTEI